MAADEMENTTKAVDAQHRAAGCFHAFLSLLKAQIVATVSNNVTVLGSPRESTADGVLTLLQHVLRTEKTDIDADVSDAVELVSQTLSQEFHGPSLGALQYQEGIEAVGRLLRVLDVDGDAIRQANALKTLMGFESSCAEKQDNERETVEPLAKKFKPEDEHLETKTQDHNSSEDDMLTAILTDALLMTEARVEETDDDVGKLSFRIAEGGYTSISAVEDQRDDDSAATKLVSDEDKPSPKTTSPPVHIQSSPSSDTRTATESKENPTQSRTIKSCMDARDFADAIDKIDHELVTTGKIKKRVSLFELRAQCNRELKEFSRALEDTQQVLKLDKTRADAYWWASTALEKLGRLGEAHSTCQRGRQQDPKNQVLKELEKDICRKALAASTKRAPEKGQPGKASSESDSANSQDGKHESGATVKEAKAAIQQGLKLQQEEKFADALTSFTKAHSLAMAANGSITLKVNVLGHLARCRLSMRMYDLAITHANEGLQLMPEWLEGHRLVCKGLMGLRQWPEALVECKTVLRDAPKDVAFLNFQTKIQANIPPPSVSSVSSPVASQDESWQSQAKKLIQTGLKLVEEENLAAGHATFTEALAALGKLADSSTCQKGMKLKILGHRARCSLTAGHFKPAATDARSGIELQTNWVEGYRLLCRALAGISKWRTALRACELVLKYAPQDADFVHVRVMLAEKSGVGDCSTTLTSPDAFAVAQVEAFEYLMLGLFGVAESRYSDAISHYEPSSQLPDDRSLEMSTVVVNRARCRIATRKFELALEDARLALVYRADWAEAHRQECLALMKLDRWKEALQACQSVLKSVPTDSTFQAHAIFISELLEKPEPSNPPPLTVPPPPPSIASDGDTTTTPNQLRTEGLALMQTQNLDAAESKFSGAIALLSTKSSKQHSKYYGDRGRCRVEMKKFEEALDDARVGLECNPDWTEGFRLMCRAFMGLNQWHNASQMYERVLEKAPHDTAFQTIKTHIDERLRRDEPAAPVGKKTTETVSPVQTTKSRPIETASASTAPPLKAGVSVARIRDLEQFAAHGSIVVQRFLYAQNCLQNARSLLRDGESVETAFDECRHGLRQWPLLEIPHDIAETLRKVAFDDAVRMGYRWGGASLYFHLQATEMSFDNYSSQRSFWEQRVQTCPHDLYARTRLAFVLYRGNEIDAALEQVETALNNRALWGVPVGDTGTPAFVVPASLQYLLAMCSPVEVPFSPLSWLTNVFSSQPEPRKRGSELLKYIQGNTVDDEWMPHACYSLGVLHLAKREYVEATQYYFLANEAEIRRTKLRLFAEIDENEFPDKAVLRTAVVGPNKVLSLSQQYEAVNRPAMCTWCQEVVRVTEFVEHKLEECVNRPSLQIKINGS